MCLLMIAWVTVVTDPPALNLARGPGRRAPAGPGVQVKLFLPGS